MTKTHEVDRSTKLTDDSKWQFAIEMELWRYSHFLVEKACDELGIDKTKLERHLEMGIRIEESTIFSDNFEEKIKLFNKMCQREKWYFGTDGRLSWWCHLHYFPNALCKKLFNKNLLTQITKILFACPVIFRSNSQWIIFRHRPLDRAFVQKDQRSNCTINSEHHSYEFRLNENIHWWLFYRYDFLFKLTYNHYEEIENMLSKLIIETRWSNNYKIYSAGYTENVWLYDTPQWVSHNMEEYFSPTSNDPFNIKNLNVYTDVRYIKTNNTYDTYNIDFIKYVWGHWEEYFKVNVPEEHKAFVKEILLFNMSGYPKERKEILNIQTPEAVDPISYKEIEVYAKEISQTWDDINLQHYKALLC